MKKVLSVLLLGAILSTVGCISAHTNQSATTSVPPAKVVSVDAYAPETELGNDRVSATVTGNSILGIIKWGMPATFADFTAIPGSMALGSNIPVSVSILDDTLPFKQAAVYIACEENQCDSLLDARYVITTKDYLVFKQIVCKVTGIPVKIKGYKKLECPKANCEK
ncbi:MAG: hypothetical protein IJS08_15420 [Victivallales bacterium]|nr:hypothetical protein [Victivallales bacterium]